MDYETDGLNRKIEIAVGGVVFVIALIVYWSSVAPTTSFWDCGEFIACSRTLGVMHPPGAPLYLLIGRIMTMLPFFKDIGLRVNIFSVIISSFTILLTYLIILQLIERWRGKPKTWEDRFILFTSGLFGALSFAFTDSFWFNSVEAEVYAFSMFFTALVVWLALKWGEQSQKASNIVLILLIFYIFGLAAGVHLLNILTFPFVLLIAFFHDNQQVRRLLMLVFVQIAIPMLFYVLLFQYNPSKMTYTTLMQHQAKAASFLKWFGLIWVIITLIYMYHKDQYVFKVWWIIPVLVIIAYSTYLVIYIRAGLDPPINENDPSTRQAFMDYLARKQYGSEDLFLTFLYRKADFWNYQLHMMYTRYFGWQFIGKGVSLDYRDRIIEIISFRGLYGLPFLVGLWGTVHHFFKDWKRALAILILFFMTGYAIIIYLNQPDPQPRERDYSYVGSFFAFALWIGIGMAGVLEWISDYFKKRILVKRVILLLSALILMIAVPINLFAFNVKSHDRSGNYVAYDYSYNLLQSCEPNAIVFTNGDNDTFPLWFLQEVEGIRKDVRVVNLSLLNTPWYIEQLRDFEPKIPIGMSDQDIESLGYIRWEKRKIMIPVPEAIRNRELQYLKQKGESVSDISISDRIVFEVKPTFPESSPQLLRVQDIMILRILEVVKWERPVYFAVTVSQENQIGLQKYLRMDGLVYRIMPYEVKGIDAELLRRNLFEKFKYRGLNDPKVNYNIGIIRLMINLRQAFIQLARHYIMKNQNEEAIKVLDEMLKRIPPEHIPFTHESIALMIAKLYRLAGSNVDYHKFTDCVIKERYQSEAEKFDLVRDYAYVFKDWDRAEEILNDLLKTGRSNPKTVGRIYGYLLDIYKQSKQYAKGIQLLENYLMRYPGDSVARSELGKLKRLQGLELSPQM